MFVESLTTQISSMLTEEEVKNSQEQLYQYFDTGYDFEVFLKEYLTEMGLDEVEVTQRGRDGGIDLTAVRKGVGDFSNLIKQIIIYKLSGIIQIIKFL